MPIPFLVGAAIGISALVGVENGASAIGKNKQANKLNATAQYEVAQAQERADTHRKEANQALEDLGKLKLEVLNGSMQSFVAAFGKLHNVELRRSAAMENLTDCQIDKGSIAELEKMSAKAATMVSGVVGGTMVLGRLVAAPAMCVLGITMNAAANKNLNNALSNSAEAEKIIEGLNVVCTLCSGVKQDPHSDGRCQLQGRRCIPQLYGILCKAQKQRIIWRFPATKVGYVVKTLGTFPNCLLSITEMVGVSISQTRTYARFMPNAR